MNFPVPSLPFPANTCEPVLEAFTLENHLKHHIAYHKKLTELLQDQACASVHLLDLLRDPSRIPHDIRQAVINNGGGYHNHFVYWHNLAAPGSTHMSPELRKSIEHSFGSVDEFEKAVTAKGLEGFGSYWVWLLDEGHGKLSLTITQNQDVPKAGKILMALDGWEHAFASQVTACTKKNDYWQNILRVVNWETVSRRLVE